MKHREQLRPLSFDEQRALEDLQKLHRDIQRARGDREQAEAEFDSFVRSFRAPQPQPVPPAPPREPRPVAAPPLVAREAIPQPPSPAPSERPAPSAEYRVPVTEHRAPSPQERAPGAEPPPPSVEHRVPRPELRAPSSDHRVPSAESRPPIAEFPAPDVVDRAPSPEPRAPGSEARKRHIPPAVAVAIGGVAIAALVFAFSGDRSEPEVVRDVPVAGAPDAAAPQPEPAAEAAQPPAPAPESGVNLELITKRPVWVRVIVDGRRAIERELPAGERIPLRAAQSIVIRAGDAGAVSVRRGSGAEAPFGEEGFPATRTFTAERRAAPPSAR